MKYLEAIAYIQGCGIHGQVRVSGCDGGSMVQICLYASCGGPEIYRVQLTGNGQCLDLPDLPMCGGRGKMTYLEGRFHAHQLPGLQIRLIPRCGCGETAAGTFCSAGSEGWDFPVPHPGPPSWDGCCSPSVFREKRDCHGFPSPAPLWPKGCSRPTGPNGRKPPYRGCGRR